MMSIITNGLKVLAFGVLLVTTHAHATDITVGGSKVSVDDRVSAGDDEAFGGYNYNIDQMDVQWSDDNTITVDIFTNFANLSSNNKTYNNKYSYGYGNNKIMFGDLMIGVDSGSSFNYAFNLGGMRYDKKTFNSTSSGGLYSISNTYTSSNWHSGAARSGIVSASTWGLTEENVDSSWGVSNGKISFSFNVTGIQAFENATTLALSWAETCFNDDVHETFAVNRGSNEPAIVPEPTTIVLMLLALVGMVYRQRIKSNSFSA